MTGTIVAFGGPKDKIPQGWVACDGEKYSRRDSKFRELFNVLGTTWGDDGTDDFRVPDLRGLFLRGVSEVTGNDPDKDMREHSRPDLPNAGNGGNNVGSKQADDLRSHQHHSRSGCGYNAGGGRDPYARNDAGFETLTLTTATGGHETRPRNAYVYFIIKL